MPDNINVKHTKIVATLGPATNSEEILRRRYANGGLTREQYQNMKATLEGGVEPFVSLSRQEHS